ncbi:hypothetical protein V8F20_007178 [Naviculisporaceae sp. PSN 640]
MDNVDYYGGLGPMVNGVLWAHVVIFGVFVVLRLYTRVSVLQMVGVDDYLTVFAFLLHILYTIFVSVATKYGLGRLFADVGNPDVYWTAVMYEVFSQVAGLMAIGVGKLAVGTFLLRIVVSPIQRGVIWTFLGFTVFITLFASITVVVQCIPVQKTWNPTLDGYCWLNFKYVGLTVGTWFVVTDFGFAILPWFVVWNLNMKRKEKLLVAIGLSLGVFAGACGIVRTVALDDLNAFEYIHDTVPMLIWSATENTVTIMCASIPVLRPLYVTLRYGSKGDSSGSASGTGGVSGGKRRNSSYKLPLYGNNSSHNRRQHRDKSYALGSSAGDETDLEHGADSTKTTIKTGPDQHNNRTVITYNADNASDESILRDTRITQGAGHGGGAGIMRVDQVKVTYEGADGVSKLDL